MFFLPRSGFVQQPHQLGLDKAAPLRYAALSSRLCGTLWIYGNTNSHIFILTYSLSCPNIKK